MQRQRQHELRANGDAHVQAKTGTFPAPRRRRTLSASAMMAFLISSMYGVDSPLGLAAAFGGIALDTGMCARGVGETLDASAMWILRRWKLTPILTALGIVCGKHLGYLTAFQTDFGDMRIFIRSTAILTPAACFRASEAVF